MKVAIHTFDICPVYRQEGRQGEPSEIEVSDELWRDYEAALDRLQELLVEIDRLRRLLIGETKTGATDPVKDT